MYKQLPASTQFTPEEAEELRRVAREAINKRKSGEKQEQLEKLAEELGYELTPIGESEE